MTTKSITTANGKTITVEMVRKVQDKVNYADGYNIVTGREIIDITTITLQDAAGKTIANGNHLMSVSQRFDAQPIKDGAVGKIGNVYLRQDTYDIVAGLIAAVEAETPKSDEQIKMEEQAAQAKIEYDNWYNSPEQIAHRRLMREMDNPNSDY